MAVTIFHHRGENARLSVRPIDSPLAGSAAPRSGQEIPNPAVDFFAAHHRAMVPYLIKTLRQARRLGAFLTLARWSAGEKMENLP
jgi:hypothetical protein